MSLRVRVCMGTAGEQREGRKQCNYILISKPTLEKSKGLLWLTVWRSQSMTGRHHFQSWRHAGNVWQRKLFSSWPGTKEKAHRVSSPVFHKHVPSVPKLLPLKALPASPQVKLGTRTATHGSLGHTQVQTIARIVPQPSSEEVGMATGGPAHAECPNMVHSSCQAMNDGSHGGAVFPWGLLCVYHRAIELGNLHPKDP